MTFNRKIMWPDSPLKMIILWPVWQMASRVNLEIYLEGLFQSRRREMLGQIGSKEMTLRIKGNQLGIVVIFSWNDFCEAPLEYCLQSQLASFPYGCQTEFSYYSSVGLVSHSLMNIFSRKSLKYRTSIMRIKRRNGCESTLQSTVQMEAIFITSKSIQFTKRKITFQCVSSCKQTLGKNESFYNHSTFFFFCFFHNIVINYKLFMC